MKRFFLAALAIAAIASCTKNEVTPSDPQEITYQAVVGKATKALVETTAYPTSETFGTVAYKVKGGNSELYIPISEVSNPTSAISGAAWTTATPYYWPKDGSTLTFYSYSPFKDNGGTDIGGVSSTKDGLTIKDYSVASANRQLTDLMVAEPITGQTQNGSNGGFTGVQTIFKHKLAQVVAINFQTVAGDPATVKDYANGHDGTAEKEYKAGDKVYTVTDVTFLTIPEQGTYTNATTEGWVTTGSATSEIEWIKGNTTSFTGGKYETTRTTNGYLLVIPQTFTADSQQLKINYKVETYTGVTGSLWATETIEETVDLKDLHTSWDMNKKYTYTISIGLNQIYWAPSVAVWDTTMGTGSASI